MLCAKCRDLCAVVDSHRDKDFLHHDIEEFRQSVNAGCRLCGIINADLEEKRDTVLGMSCRVLIKLRRNIGLEVSFVGPTPGADGEGDQKFPRVYVNFRSLELPRECLSVREISPTKTQPSPAAINSPVS